MNRNNLMDKTSIIVNISIVLAIAASAALIEKCFHLSGLLSILVGAPIGLVFVLVAVYLLSLIANHKK